MAGRAHVATLLSNASATGSAVNWPGGRGKFIVEGTFDSETVAMQFETPQGTFIDYQAGLTAQGHQEFFLPACKLKATVTAGGGSPSGLYAWAMLVDAQ